MLRDHTKPKLKATGGLVVVLQAQAGLGELPIVAVVSGFKDEKDADTFGSDWVAEQNDRTGQAMENGVPLFAYTVYEEATPINGKSKKGKDKDD
jgi:hypothetical protein